MNLKESKDWHMGGLVRRNEKEGGDDVTIISKII